MDSKPDEIYEKKQDTKYTNYSYRDKSCPAIPEILLCSPDGIIYRKAGIVDPGQETAIIIICGGSEKAYPFGNRMTALSEIFRFVRPFCASFSFAAVSLTLS